MKKWLKYIKYTTLALLYLFLCFCIGAILPALFSDDLTVGEAFRKAISPFALLFGLYVLAVFMLSFIPQTIIHEFGHLVGGWLSGYRFSSFRIFSWGLIREDGKLKIKNYKIAGTVGQCLMVPPDKPIEEIPTTLYNLGGIASNFVFSAVPVILWVVLSDEVLSKDTIYWSGLIFFFAFAGLMMIIINGIPMKSMGFGNDGYNTKAFRTNPADKETFINQLRANAMLQEGAMIKDMPQEWFEDKGGDRDPVIKASSIMMRVSYLMDNGDFEEAHLTLEETFESLDKTPGPVTSEYECELLFTSLVTGRKELAKKLYTAELQKYIDSNRKVMSSKERLIWAIAYYMEKDMEKAGQSLATIQSRQDEYLYKGEAKMDISIIKRLLS